MKPFVSKRHPVEVLDTGPEAATKFRVKRRISRTHGSSLRKLDRETRIHNRTAILKYGVPTRRERIFEFRARRAAELKAATERAALRAAMRRQS